MSFKVFADDLYKLNLEDLMEIRVSVSSLFEESLLQSPSTVSVIERSEWNMRPSRWNVEDLLDFEPGIVSYDSLAGTGLVFRGYASNILAVRGKGYLIDGVPINTYSFRTGLYGRAMINPEVFDRLETIRGPGSALYGTDSFFGVLSYRTYSPDFDETEVSTSVSDHKVSNFSYRMSHRFEDEGRLSAALGFSGQGAQNIAYTARSMPGTVLSREETWQTGSSLLKWDFERGDSRYNLTFLYHQWETDGVPSLLRFTPGATGGMNGNSIFSMLKFSGITKLENNRELSFKIYNWNSSLMWDSDPNSNSGDISDRSDRRSGISVRYKQQETEDRKLRFAAGLELDRLTVTDQYSFSGGNNQGIPGFVGENETVKSLYFQGRYPLREEKLHLHLGSRLDQYPGFGSQFTPRWGLIQTLREGEVLKYLYGNAFRAAGAQERFGTPTITGGVLPEEIDSHELVYEKQTRDSRFTLTYFKSELKNGILFIFTPAVGGINPPDRYENLGRSESSGFEFEAVRQLDEEWKLKLSGSLIESRDLLNKRDFVGFPGNIFNFQADYSPSDSNYTVWVGARHMSDWQDHFGDSTAGAKLASYNRIDLGLRYELGKKTHAYLWVRNLFDQDLKKPSVWDSENGVPEMGRAIGMGLTYRF